MLDEVVMQYKNFIRDFTELTDKFLHVVKYITTLDVLQSKVYVATTNKLCRPTIKEHNKAYFSCKGLRHLLIEQLNTSELYVSNDVELGKEKDGVLIYGTNAVGKTSLIRSLGICIIMAQAGLYVPCREMDYSPYTQIFTRIIYSKDCLLLRLRCRS
jgi:DNA mismatch repair protein MutS